MMDNIREKLVELLLAVDSVCNKGECGDCGAENCFIYRAADHLIAHGVMVQEWIPVSERLPEPFVSVLVHMPLEEPCPTVREGYITRDGIWHSALYDREPDEVTHWMPLPTPPKGE